MSRKNRPPTYWGKNAVRQAERRFIQERNSTDDRENDTRKATAEVFIMCILSALYDDYGMGEARLQRAADAACERSERYEQTKNGLPRLVDGKKKTGQELADMELDRDVADYFPADFVFPIWKMPKKRDIAIVYNQRAAATTAAKLYAYGMHTALGFGADRIKKVMEAATENYRMFREYADSGDYYGYTILARKMSQILHCPCDVVSAGADRPIFGDTLD